ncbi:unnamed protein product [Polarella glacialis]|uniref:Uncharacterized protein n=1 Tax=Polarella glacialis TaxID=89957 RepID=A0A813DMM2_POLGL|nr:unnamed protein product [Polarella glacialis]
MAKSHAFLEAGGVLAVAIFCWIGQVGVQASTTTTSTTSFTATSTWTTFTTTSSTTSSTTTVTTMPAGWCEGFDSSLLDKSSKAYCKKQEIKAYMSSGLWEQRSKAVSGERIAGISISSVMLLLLGILGATSLVAWRRGALSRPAPLSDPGDGFPSSEMSETNGLLSSDGLEA